MKIRISVLVLTFGLVFWMGGSLAQAATPSYLGQTTWTAHVTHDESGPLPEPQTVTITGGITKMGDTYYSFQGYITMPDETNPRVMSGGGVLLEGQIILTCSASQLHPDGVRDTGVLQVTLNQSDLSGSFFEIGQFFVGYPDPIGNSFHAGPLFLTGPMIPLTSSLAVPLSLLLE